MLTIRLSGVNLSVPQNELVSSDTNEDIHVILSSNGILRIVSSLWTTIFSDTRLRCLSLIDLQLYGNDTQILAKYLRETSNLIELTLDSVLQSVYSFDHILNEGLQYNKSIESLTLTNLNNIDAATIASLIKHNNTIKYLSLVHNDISSDGGALIVDALRTNSTLIKLDLSRNRIDEQMTKDFTKILNKPHSSLREIIIDNNRHNVDENQEVPNRNSSIENKAEIEPFIVEEKPVNDDQNLQPKKKKLLFLSTILVTFLFFLWGIPNHLNVILIRQFRKIFVLSSFELGLVQSAFYMGYFIWALPAAYVLRRWGYKVGIIIGLVLFGTGSFLFWPCAYIGEYVPFLISLFIIATGLAFLETAANPFIANAAGPSHSSEKRLNIAQAFNPLGAMAGVLIGTLFIFSGVELSDKQIQGMRADRTYNRYLEDETLRVVRPYAVIGGIAYLWAIIVGFVPFPANVKKSQSQDNEESNESKSLCRPMFIFAIIAQFAYVGAQIGTWSYFMKYAQDYVSVGEKTSGYLLTGTLAMFAIGRLTAALLMHCGFSASILLAAFAFINVLLVVITVLVPNAIGLGALFLTSFFMSLMFPTIFALGIKGMSAQTTKLASCLLIMAIIGGAVVTPLMGLIAEQTNRLALAYTLPGGAYMIIGIYALSAYALSSEKTLKS